MTKKEKDLDTFFLTFSGQEIVVTLNNSISATHHAEEGFINESVPLSREGFLLDYDEDWIYLGNSPTEINRAILKSNILDIEVKEEPDLFTQVLEEFEPQTNEEIN